MTNAGSFIYTFENGVSTMHTLPNAIVSEINSETNDKTYIEHTVSSKSFYLGLHRPYIIRPGVHDEMCIKDFMDILNDGIYAQFNSGDAAIIYELIVRDMLEFEYTNCVTETVRSRCHYFEESSGEIYDIKVIYSRADFVILISDITPNLSIPNK